MNVSRFKSLLACGLVIAVAVGGATTFRQNDSRLCAAPPSKEAVLFDVTTHPNSNIVIDGVFADDDGDGIFTSDGLGVAMGHAGKNNVAVNRPSPAVMLDFLATLPCFEDDDIYGGTIVVFENTRRTGMTFFFSGMGKEDGTWLTYRLDGDAEITPDNEGSSFPDGDPDGYTVKVTNLRLSVDTGKRKNGCVGDFPFASGTIYLDRVVEQP